MTGESMDVDTSATALSDESPAHLQLHVSLQDSVNAALWENSVPFLSELALENATSKSWSELEISLTCEPPAIQPHTWRLQQVGAGEYRSLRPQDVRLNGTWLQQQTEASRAEITFTVRSGVEELLRKTHDIRVLARSEWGGLSGVPDILAAFVLPNDPAIGRILRSASEILRAAGKPHTLEGYQRDKARVWEQAQAIWCAVCALDITYISPPASFVENGQRVRLPSQIMEERLGTCLDTALLFAACLEAVGLHPLIVITEGHAFTGVWLTKSDTLTSVTRDLPSLRNRLKLDEIKVFETTLVTLDRKPSFTVACEKGEANLRHAGEDEDNTFRELIDIHRARLRRIRPLSMPGANTTATAEKETENAGSEDQPAFEDTPSLREDRLETEEDAASSPADRISRWCNRLLDMSGRNRLLNLPKSEKQIIRIDCPDPGRLENTLASLRAGGKGRPLRFCPWPDMMKDGDPRDAALHHDRLHEDAARAYAIEALDRRELLVARTESALQAALTEIYRRGQSAEQEGGSNILYLTIGALAWTRKDGDTPWLAPLILVPVTLERPSVRSGFVLRPHGDDSRVNITLLEMLRNDYNLRFPELEGDQLPEDGNGLDVTRIITIFRAGLRNVPGWEVHDDVALTTLSFAKFLMWKDLLERRESLRSNEVARRLLDGVSEDSPSSTGAAPMTETDGALDELFSQADLACPMEADSSQLRAVARAAAGDNFVLIGPPGTGKSQTITNIIANTLAQGRSVLFVAEKRAALEVVRNRLRQIGLAEFCLDLFSPKASKMAVLEQFQTAQNVLDRFDEGDWRRSREQIDLLRGELNAYVHELHQRWRNGWTPFRAIGVVLRADDAQLLPLTFTWPSPDMHDEDGYEALCKAADDIASVHERIGDVISSPVLSGLDRTEWGPQWEKDFVDAARTLLTGVEQLAISTKAVRKTLNLGIEDMSLPALQHLRILCACLEKDEASAWAFAEDSDATRNAMHAEKPHIARHGELTAQLSVAWKPEAKALPLDDLLKTWNEAQEKSVFQFLAKSKAIKSVRKQLEPHADGALPEDCAPDLQRLIALRDIEKHLADAPHGFTVGTTLWQGLDTDFDRVDAHHAWGRSTRAALATCAPDVTVLLAARTHLRALLSEGRDLLTPGGSARASFDTFSQNLETVIKNLETFATISETAPDRMADTTAPDWLPALTKRLRGWIAASRNLRDWCNWKLTCQRAERLGLGPLVDAVESGLIPAPETVTVFEANYARWWLTGAVERSPLLRGFVAATHERSIERFRELDRQIMKMATQLTRARLAGQIPDAQTRATDTEYKVLTREAAKKARHLPIRQLAEKMPHALRQLTPCLMMSPLSVAQYLPHDAQPFDLVIFDEASQIPTWDAIGVIGRGRQVIVVGDPKQLPPTDFFNRSASEDESVHDAETCDLESILDECRGAGIPSVQLNWHYRSRHESLIAFSNHAYYGGQLITFPSPVTQDRAVSFRFVPDGVYLRGGARTNPMEAQAIVAEALTLLRDGTNRSLGIVTFNSEQQTLITDLFDKARESHPDIERFFNDDANEPVLIRNLENVQGEERDIMLFSLTYGPNQANHMTLNFGPLNRDGGERRLNVAITRAREKLVVFGSFRPDRIDINRTSAQGVRDLRKFLVFAEHGSKALASVDEGSVGGFDSLFEEEVAALLRGKGWQVIPQVGVSGFRIDLGIVDPDRPATFLAGVECDGATYHRSATARDRDRLRQTVLEGLGWSILRIWSTDWWTNAARECDRIDQQLRSVLEQTRKRRAEQEERDRKSAVAAQAAAEEALRENASKPEEDTKDSAPHAPEKTFSTTAEMPRPTLLARGPVDTTEPTPRLPADHERFFEEDYTPHLQAMIEYLVTEKGPIREDILVQSLSRNHGFARVGRDIRQRILTAIPPTLTRSMEDCGTFIWPPHFSPETDIPFPAPAAGESLDPSTVPLAALVTLARSLDENGYSESDLLSAMRKACGMGRMGAATRARLEKALTQARSTPACQTNKEAT